MSYAKEDVSCPGEGSQAATLILALLMGHYPLKKVNPHKAPGPVGIPGGVLRACAPPSSSSDWSSHRKSTVSCCTNTWPLLSLAYRRKRATHGALTHLEKGSTYCDLHHHSFETPWPLDVHQHFLTNRTQLERAGKHTSSSVITNTGACRAECSVAFCTA